MTRYTKTMMEALSEVRYNSYKLQEATIDLRDHDMTDPDFQKLIKKVKLKAKELKGDDGTTVTGSAKDIEKMLSTMYGNDWKDMYKQKGQKFIELEQVEMEEELDELKMNDPKLVRKFDKLKKGDTVKLKTSSTISKGTDFVDYVVKAKNTVNKGRVEKITLVTKGNEKAVKKFLYKRDGKVTFAIGDMGASIDDIKEELDEGMKYTHVAVDKKGLVIGFASDEKDAKDMARRNDGKVVKLKKPMSDKKGDMMVNRPFKEEDEKKMDKPDSAKAVDQARDDKKKTRIAQLQLQIAKASEMINKLNSQEKPDA